MSTTCARPACVNKGHHGYGGYCQKHGRHLGIVREKVSAEPSRHIIQNLLDDGMTYRSIATSASLPHTTVRKIMTAGYPNVRQATHDALHTLVEQRMWIPSWRSARRIQSLRAAGFTLTELAEGLGSSRSMVHNLSSEAYETTTRDLFERVHTFYAEHQMDPIRPVAPSTAKHGWPLPMVWDDIDDPDERYTRLTREQIKDQIPVTDTHVDAVFHLQDVHDGLYAASAATKISQPSLISIRDGKSQTASRELLHRVLHHAGKAGWAYIAQEVAA